MTFCVIFACQNRDWFLRHLSASILGKPVKMPKISFKNTTENTSKNRSFSLFSSAILRVTFLKTSGMSIEFQKCRQKHASDFCRNLVKNVKNDPPKNPGKLIKFCSKMMKFYILFSRYMHSKFQKCSKKYEKRPFFEKSEIL